MTVKIKLRKPEPRTAGWQVQKDSEHFFVCSNMYWQTGTDLLEVLTRQAKLDKSAGAHQCAVYKVPLPADAPYEINYYAPQVEGAELVTIIEYDYKK